MTYWISEAERETFNRFLRQSELWVIRGSLVVLEVYEARQKLKRDLKWAYIMVGNTRKMAWVDKKTGKAYKADGYDETWVEWKNFKFVRWCRPMDL